MNRARELSRIRWTLDGVLSALMAKFVPFLWHVI
jgi:hypothetical protein